MCAHGVFPSFLENNLLKVDKIQGWLFLRQEKTWKDSKRRFSIYCSWVLSSMNCLQLPFIRVEEAVSWTQLFWETIKMISSLILLRSLSVYLLKQLFFSISVNSGFRNIYLAASQLGKYLPIIHLDFKE